MKGAMKSLTFEMDDEATRMQKRRGSGFALVTRKASLMHQKVRPYWYHPGPAVVPPLPTSCSPTAPHSSTTFNVQSPSIIHTTTALPLMVTWVAYNRSPPVYSRIVWLAKWIRNSVLDIIQSEMSPTLTIYGAAHTAAV